MELQLRGLVIGVLALGLTWASAGRASDLFGLGNRLDRTIYHVNPYDGSKTPLVTLPFVPGLTLHQRRGLSSWPYGSKQLITFSWNEGFVGGGLNYCLDLHPIEVIDAATGDVETLPALDPDALGLPEGMMMFPVAFAVSPIEPDLLVTVGILHPIACGLPIPIFYFFFIDLKTGTATRPYIPYSSVPFAGNFPLGMAFSPEGVLYAGFQSLGGNLGIVDLETGNVERVPGSTNWEVASLAFRPENGRLFALVGPPGELEGVVVALDPVSGTISEASAIPAPGVSIAFVPSLAPSLPALNPIGVGLLISSIALVGWSLRRGRSNRTGAS